MTDTPPEVLAMARRIAAQIIPDGSEHDYLGSFDDNRSIAEDAAIQAILETTEAAAKCAFNTNASASYALRNFDHIKEQSDV